MAGELKAEEEDGEFTLTEDVLYISSAGSQHGGDAFFQVFILRTVMAGLGHAEVMNIAKQGKNLLRTVHNGAVNTPSSNSQSRFF